jgi:hypothetical protein
LFILSHSICTLLLRCLFRYFVFVSTVLSVLHMLASDGRLFRCDVTSTLSNGAIAAADDAVSDEDWEEREASRTHSVKFSDPQDQDSKETPFVRQNTPHPRELKAKAHNLFSKGQNSLEDSDLHSESVVEAVNPTVQRPQTPPPPPPTLAIPEVTEQVIGNGAEDNSEPSAEEETIDVSCSLKAPDRASQVFRWTLRRSVAGGSPDCRFFRVLSCTRSKTVNGGCAGIGT